ncbi:hypothetical protein G5I_09391 [Acromyrmex echinatior]|uniref:Uncharacterized protein n=1 Tax=Acromyrmex echinatior TaxID=103372 RepID=F4WU36_ACREC|nr:hypothetical protein G5I_09391 [Acromyrmex echinatior]
MPRTRCLKHPPGSEASRDARSGGTQEERDEGTEDVKYTGLSIHLFAGCFGKRYGSGDADADADADVDVDATCRSIPSLLLSAVFPTLSVFINLFHPKRKKTQSHARKEQSYLPASRCIHRIDRNACYSAVRKSERPVVGPLAGGAK